MGGFEALFAFAKNAARRGAASLKMRVLEERDTLKLLRFLRPFGTGCTIFAPLIFDVGKAYFCERNGTGRAGSNGTLAACICIGGISGRHGVGKCDG